MRIRQRPLEIDVLELGGEDVQDGLRKFIEIPLVREDGTQVRLAPVGRRGVRRGRRQEPRFERPLRPWADNG